MNPGLMLMEETVATTGGMTSIIAAMSDVWSLVGTTVTNITSQPVLLFLLAAGLVPVGIRLFKSLKRAVK